MTSPNDLDDAIKDIVDKNYGVNAADIDFFLRDNFIDPNTTKSGVVVPESTPPATEKHVKRKVVEKKPSPEPPTKREAFPTIRNQPTNLESLPQAADLRRESVSSQPEISYKKRGLVLLVLSQSLTSSTGGFFNKLKGRLHRSLSLSEANKHQGGPHPPRTEEVTPLPAINQEPPVFNKHFGFDNPLAHPPTPRRSLYLPVVPSENLFDAYVRMFSEHTDRKEAGKIREWLNDEIPEHPDSLPWPLVLVNGATKSPINPEALKQDIQAQSKFTSLLRRRTITSDLQNDLPPSSKLLIDLQPTSTSESKKFCKPLLRVAFALNTFLIDPPQQIPLRNPRQGNVTVENGTLHVRPLTDEEKKQVELSLMGKGGGIVVGGTGALGTIDKVDDDEEDAGVAMAPSLSNDPEDPAIDDHMKNVAIDKPLVKPRSDYYLAPVKKMALDLMYTRCCHLREILPIPAILKQIPKGLMLPIPLLQIRNPAPLMIEIQTFADFIRIAPIVCLSLDGVQLSVEQFKIILSAISLKTQMEKLLLRNTPIDHDGWELLCWFLSRNLKLDKLDITQCPSLQVNVTKKKKKLSKLTEEITRMACNMDNRSDMNWELFVASLLARGGIEELILTGCCINDLDLFEKLIYRVIFLRTLRLGLAFNQLDHRHMKILMDWVLSSKARGLDLGYNDFSSQQMVDTVIRKLRSPGSEKLISQALLAFLSLNCTNMPFCDEIKEMFDIFLTRLPNLKYLDLSNCQRFFGTLPNGDNIVPESECVNYFLERLPLFPQLIRCHLERNNFSKELIIQVAKTLPFCRRLSYFSLKGNTIDITCATALVQAVKNSLTIIYLECDYDNFPLLYKERVGLYTMRNMEQLLQRTLGSGDTNARANANSLTQQLNKLLSKKAEQKLDIKDAEVREFITRAIKVKQELRSSIQQLLNMQLKQELDLEGKETLIRFIYLDLALSTGLLLIDPEILQNQDTMKVAEQQALELVQRTGAEGQDRIGPGLETDKDVPMEEVPLIQEQLTPAVLRLASRTNIQSLEKEEGLFMKLGQLLKFHLPNSSDKLEGVSGDEIREKLSAADLDDLDAIIAYMLKLKAQGITFRDLYNSSEGHECGPELEYTHEKILELEKRMLDLACKDGTEVAVPADDRYPKQVASKEDYGEIINEAYNSLVKSYTHESD